jgi:hypothetical protein
MLKLTDVSGVHTASIIRAMSKLGVKGKQNYFMEYFD